MNEEAGPNIVPEQEATKAKQMEEERAQPALQEVVVSSSDEYQRKPMTNPFTIITARNAIKKQQHKCENKICTSQDRKVFKMESGCYRYLCEFCNSRFKEKHFCYYCSQIYFEQYDGASNWIQCSKCLKWVHNQCEEKFGDPNITIKMAKNQKLPYYCPLCKPPKTIVGANKKQSNAPKQVRQYRQTKDKNRFIRRNDCILNSYGFYWKLKPQQIQSDLQKLRKL